VNNVLGYGDAFASKDPGLIMYKERAENSISIGLRRHLSRSDFNSFFDLLDSIIALDMPLDELNSILSSRCSEVTTRVDGNLRIAVARLNKIFGKISSASSRVLSTESKKSFQELLKETIQKLNDEN
jgi:hypothetical protein